MTRDAGPENPNEKSDWDVDAMWARVRARTIDATDEPRLAPRPELVASRRGRNVAITVGYASAYAAALLLVAGAATMMLRAPQADDSVAVRPGQYRTSRGQHATITLSDGTNVALAPESRLTVSPHFADGVREIILDGEAAFTVRHDSAHPFRVRAHGALVEDVGTRFDLRAYPGDAGVTVAVVEGSVMLRSAKADSESSAAPRAPAIVLDSGEVGTIAEHSSAPEKRATAAAEYLAWTRGRLTFVDRPLPEVLRAIARWYDLDVRVADTRLAERRVTAEFAADSSSGAVDALAVALNVNVQRNGRVLTLRPR